MFRAIYTTPVKIFPFCREPCIFSHLRTNQSAAQQVRDPSMQISGNRKEPSLMKTAWGRTSQLSASNVSRTGFAVCDGALS